MLELIFHMRVQGTAATHVEAIEEKTRQAILVAMMDALSFTIDRISCEVFSSILVRLLNFTRIGMGALMIYVDRTIFSLHSRL